MNISISTSFIDSDADSLVRSILDTAQQGLFSVTNVSSIISTREPGDREISDGFMQGIKRDYPSIPIITYSAKQHGRLGHDDEGTKLAYDSATLSLVRETVGQLPAINVMVGDMIARSEYWCDALPSLNLHPDLPPSLGGVKGAYWKVIGEWVRTKRAMIGGMMHVAVKELDGGSPIAYFCLPAHGLVNGVDLAPLWDALPQDPEALERLIQEQVALKDKPTNPLFQELRRAEASFEQRLVLETLKAFDEGGTLPIDGFDMTDIVVGESAVWPGIEGRRGVHETL